MAPSKPHLRKSRIWTWLWSCRIGSYTGFGVTPASAYEALMAQLDFNRRFGAKVL